LAYVPCGAHNIQLVIKDGLKLNTEYTNLINRVGKDIVNKTKVSTLIAEELRQFNKKLNKKNATRWNSILFMIRSVLKLSPDEFKAIRLKMSTKTAEQRETKKKFDLSKEDREMLEELKVVLEMFEFVTDEFQSNKISISRVYPCVIFLKKGLISNLNDYKFTQQLRQDLYQSLNKRFHNVIEDDIFLVSSFLDPNFGLDCFDIEKKKMVRQRIISLLKQEDDLCFNSTSGPTQVAVVDKLHPTVEKRINNYIFFRETKSANKSDKAEEQVDDYIRTLSSSKFTCPLIFWKGAENKFPELANLAKKFLGIQASSASVERMFSISGHIFQCKRRSMGTKLFTELVFLKLNEDLL
jgi:hypothetical protein